ncbi:MAG: cytochrome c oxidase assembly protein [Gammaproteobacteria bacterium]|jgi:cytochrome c oxidase assembly protein subunit 11|nr:cytochrome c oxidase assembly protein [Gammaproteobacteria bacterium]MBT7603871.1 cytochrome c oxidase assembly protein [Gammaproteobacteria bacterium]
MKDMKMNVKTAKKLIIVCFGMFLFSFALVPLYNVICDVTGLNGNTSNLREKTEQHSEKISNEKLNIQFISNEINKDKIDFKPSEFEMTISPGKVYSTYFLVRNKSSSIIEGQAIPSVSPNEASIYLNKIKCFCFEKQIIEPGEVVKLPLYFSVSEKLPVRIKTLTLSYTFFDLVKVSKKD